MLLGPLNKIHKRFEKETFKAENRLFTETVQELFGKYRNRIHIVSLRFERSLSEKIDWNARALCITGARGVGKSTLMLQHIKRALPLSETLYVSMYDLCFRSHIAHRNRRDILLEWWSLSIFGRNP